MELGMVGLGRMGGNMALRLSKGGHDVVGYDPNQQVVQDYVNQGISGASSLEDLVGKLSAPRTVWSMVPSGEVTEATVNRLGELLSPGDTVNRRRKLLLQGQRPPRRRPGGKGHLFPGLRDKRRDLGGDGGLQPDGGR